MDASRLLAVLLDITDEINAGTKPVVATLLQAYTAARDTPTQDLTAPIDVALTKLEAHLRTSVTTAYPPSRAQILAAIAADTFVGAGAIDAITSLLAVAQRTPASAVTALTTYSQQLASYLKTSTQAVNGLQQLGIAPQVLAEGEYEVGILIPESLTASHLGELVKQLAQWNTALRGFAEAAGEENPEVVVRDLSSGSYEAFLAVGYLTAKMLGVVIERVLGWYERILEIQLKRKELAALGAPVAETKEIEKHEKKYIEDSIADLVKELIANAPGRISGTRRAELETHLTVSVRHVVKFVDRGGDVEVSAGLPPEPEEPTLPPAEATDADNEAYKKAKDKYDALEEALRASVRLSEQGAQLRRLPARPTPILQLKDGTQPDQTDPKEPEDKKAPKR